MIPDEKQAAFSWDFGRQEANIFGNQTPYPPQNGAERAKACSVEQSGAAVGEVEDPR